MSELTEVARITTVRDRVRHHLVGRERELDLVLAAVAAGRDIILEGPPGTSKSTLLRAITAEWGIPLVFVEGNGGRREVAADSPVRRRQALQPLRRKPKVLAERPQLFEPAGGGAGGFVLAGSPGRAGASGPGSGKPTFTGETGTFLAEVPADGPTDPETVRRARQIAARLSVPGRGATSHSRCKLPRVS